LKSPGRHYRKDRQAKAGLQALPVRRSAGWKCIDRSLALISGRVYPTLGVSKLFWRATIVAVIAALAALIPALIASRREPSEALHYV
jgi:hypothetical protein